jgi:WhiB family transcriptional regulator, redox-sensing transcriptional regulator
MAQAIHNTDRTSPGNRRRVTQQRRHHFAPRPRTVVRDVAWEGSTLMWDENWTAAAACQHQPDAFFVEGAAAQHHAKRLCWPCPVRTECLAEALDHRITWGVWGGLTERERRGLLRRRPSVTSWRQLLESARVEHPQHNPAQTLTDLHSA